MITLGMARLVSAAVLSVIYFIYLITDVTQKRLIDDTPLPLVRGDFRVFAQHQ